MNDDEFNALAAYLREAFDDDDTLILAGDTAFTDAAQLQQFRREMAGLEPLPFDAIASEDLED